MDEKIQRVIEGFAQDVENAASDNLVSLILHGSAASGTFVDGRSDLNFLVVLASADEESLAGLAKPVKKWRKKGVALPFIMDLDDLQRSLDSFPIEFLDMKLGHKVIRGDDVLAGLVIEAEDLRLECEREIKGKLIQLRRGYIELGMKPARRDALFRQSIKTFLIIMRSMLWLEGRDPAPLGPEEVIAGIEEVGGKTLPHCRKVLEYRTGKPKLARTEAHRLFGGYLGEIEALADWIDEWVSRQEDEK